MKLWYGYGSEHSNNLVMIGHFESVEDAEETLEQINHLIEILPNMVDIDNIPNRFEEEIYDLLRKEKIYNLGPTDLEQFLYETHTKIADNKIILTTEELEVSAFMKLMINKGAKVEIFSAHDYPDAEYGRGK
jgi:septation ring formation regulator EzrA